jgi:mono/diheme cytochrome c family protein
MKSIWIVWTGTLALGAFVMTGHLTVVAHAQDAADYFHQNCTMCHTVGGGRLIGPDLGGVTKLKDRAWLVQFLQDPKARIDSGDSYAAQLFQDANGVVMPTPPGMTPALADSILSYLEAGPGAAQSPIAGPLIKDRPFTEADVVLGRRFFLGQQPLAGGGPPCVSCHTLRTVGSLGGGRLGPDLTNEFGRLGGRRGATAWLTSPPTTTMQAVFSKHPLESEEILPLLAAIDDASRQEQPQSNTARVKFSGIGLGGMLISLVLLQVMWRGRLRSVRRSVIRAQVRGEQ